MVLITAASSPAHADYSENFRSREIAITTLVAAGTASAVFNIGCTVYLSRGRDESPVRIINGVGALLAAGGLIAPTVFALAFGGPSHIPGGRQDTEEEKAWDQTQLYGGFNIAMAAVSLGLGTATLATYGEPDVDDGNREPRAARLWLRPATVRMPGFGLALAGEF
jgi:hypothetical protein